MKIRVHDEYSETLKISQKEVLAFAELTGDDNPIHIDKEYALKKGFNTNIVHGILSAGVFSRILGTKFPGYGSIYTYQDLKFIRPVYVDQKFTVNLKVISKSDNKYVISTQIHTQEGIALNGTANILYKES